MGLNINPNSLEQENLLGLCTRYAPFFRRKQPHAAMDGQTIDTHRLTVTFQNHKSADDAQVFVPLGKRSHANYNIKHFILQKHSPSALSTWIEKHYALMIFVCDN